MRSYIVRLVMGALLVATATLSPADVLAQDGTRLKFGHWARRDAVFSNRAYPRATQLFEPCLGIGFVDEEIILGPDGRFDVVGRFKFNNPVPEAPTFPVRFVGQVTGTRMALTVVSLDPANPLLRSYVLDDRAKRKRVNCS